ncbi:MAG: prolipoprotein diacylglyceryl transferase [Acidimicrobiia bacterium]|nr:prolipoprotein diacylglyceryl transferase [Acidimicrobiia bacterium]
MPLIASIPSPSSGTIDIGINLHVYGILLAIGVVIAATMAERRWKRWGHDPHDFQNIVVVVVICGVVGARLYHVISDYQLFEGDWLRVFEIWKGGLSIWGVVIGGMLGIIVMCRRKGYDTLGLMDAIVPGLLVAQALGRFGNWFNQELFGEPSKLPWALEIDKVNRPAGFEHFATFHPTFLYESLYCLALFFLLVQVERRTRLRRGQLGAIYVMGYTFGRFWLEHLRIDDANLVLGFRVNAWVSALCFLAGALWFRWLGRHSSTDEQKYQSLAEPNGPAA